MLITPIILLNFKRKSAKAYWYLLLFYVFAKLFEHFDGQIFGLFGFISGHSIKHIVAALGLFIFLLVEKKDLKHH
jgi:hypothetical protein